MRRLKVFKIFNKRAVLNENLNLLRKNDSIRHKKNLINRIKIHNSPILLSSLLYKFFLICIVVALGFSSEAKENELRMSDLSGNPKLIQIEKFDISPPLKLIKPLSLSQLDNTDSIAGALSKIYTEVEAIDSKLNNVTQLQVGNLSPPLLVDSFDSLPNLSGYSSYLDPIGDIGPNHYVVMNNTHLEIYDRSGISVFGPVVGNTLWSGFGGGCDGLSEGDDPVVLYDQFVDRW